MNVKQKSLLVLSVLFVGSVLFGAIVSPADSAQALTKEQWKECRKKYQGLTLINEQKSREAWQKFKDSKCTVENGGNCGSNTTGSGTFSTTKADCPISDKYLVEYENYEPEVISSGDEDCTDCILNDPVAGDDCGGVSTAIIKCNAKNSGDVSDNGIWALLLIAINIMTAGVGILAVGGIVYGSILYTTAEDKADQVKKATDIITNVIIGLIAFALMWAGLNFLIPGGVFAV